MWNRLGRIVLYVAVGFLTFVLLMVIALHLWEFFEPDMRQVKKLGQHYAVSYAFRDTYFLTYYTIGYSSSVVPIVVDDAIRWLEFDHRWIFMNCESGSFWIVDKTIPNGKFANNTNGIQYNHSVIGPMDSTSFVHFKDSVGFVVASPENEWEMGYYR